ncbi:MAG: hypothetical protein OK438_00375 [Thaumarchaeota archaeon]|nr:hypothetical protein [Nitrososphaerota archaeon]
MTVEPTDLLIPTIHIVTLLITGTSATYVLRQKTTEYLQVRNLLVMVHIFYMAVVAFELARNFVPAPSPTQGATSFFLGVYTISNTTFVLVDVLILTLIALAIYYRPNGRGLLDILKEVFRHQMQATFLGIYVVYIAIAEGYLLAFRPFGSEAIPNIVGTNVIATQFNPLYLDMLLGILVIFITYPSTLLLAARARSTDRQVRRAFAILPIAWAGIGLDLLVFNGYLLNSGIDASAVGYLFAAAAFAATAATFRRATLLSSFFLPPVAPTGAVEPSATFSGRLGFKPEAIVGKEFLLEVNPAVRFEESIKDFANELASEQYVVFAFTARGSPVYSSLSPLGNVRFFTMTSKVSYPKPGEKPNEVMVPSTDQSVLLNVLDKAITTNPNLKLAVIFDSVTDLLLSSGLETTYKFLKQANEMINNNKVTSVFLMTQGAHSDREVNVVKSLFSNHLAYTNGQLGVQKGS